MDNYQCLNGSFFIGQASALLLYFFTARQEFAFELESGKKR